MRYATSLIALILNPSPRATLIISYSPSPALGKGAGGMRAEGWL